MAVSDCTHTYMQQYCSMTARKQMKIARSISTVGNAPCRRRVGVLQNVAQLSALFGRALWQQLEVRLCNSLRCAYQPLFWCNSHSANLRLQAHAAVAGGRGMAWLLVGGYLWFLSGRCAKLNVAEGPLWESIGK